MANLTGSTTAVFFVRLSTAVDEIVDVDWNTRDGTAIAGQDYEAASGTVSFLPGETEKAIDVVVYGQDDVSADGKKFYIELKPPANAVLTDALAECVITVADEDGVLVTSLVVAQGKRGLKGNPGLSAYEQAVLMGYVGTVEQWMEKEANAARAAERAEAAAVAANIASKVFASPESGVNPNTGVPVGDYFNVRSPLSTHYVDEYQNIGGAAVPTGKSYPSAKGLMDAIAATEANAIAAEMAATAANIAGKVYSTPEAGVDPITGVPNGYYFNVRSASNDNYIDEYQNVDGTPTATGKSYPSSSFVHGLAEYVPLPYKNGATYSLYERVTLTNGDIVKSTVAGNTNDPNVNMSGWVNVRDASFVVDASGKTQQEFNDTLRNLKTDGAIGDGNLHPVSKWITSGRYSSLVDIQTDYPHVTSLDDSIDWATIQGIINSLPYNDTSTINPKISPNGGIVRVPRGKYIFNKKITLKRGVVLQGESRESTQFWSLNTDGLIEYDDVGRYLSDELQIQDISLWQDTSVTPISGAGIRIRSSGLVPKASVTPTLKNLIIEGFYNNLDIGDCINLTMYNINQSKSVSHGGIIDSVYFSTSSLLSSCYAHSCGASGWLLKKMYYVSLQGMASDSNASYGYELEDCRGVVLHGGAEANGNKALKLKNSNATNLMLSAVNNVEGASDIDASFYTSWSCGMLIDNRAGSTKTAITGLNGANFFEITKGVNLEGSYATNRVVNINNYDDRALSTAIGSNGKNWQLGVNQAIQTASQFFFGGVTSDTTQNGLDLQPNFAKSVNSINKTLNIVFRAASADSFANAVGSYIGNAIISGGGSIARKIGQMLEKQTGGTSANAALYLTKGSALPVGNWSLVNDQDLPSYFADKLKFGATASTAPYLFSGTGAPTDTTAPIGSLYTRIDGTDGATLYIKEPAGWVAK